jgi:hypothetical protein
MSGRAARSGRRRAGFGGGEGGVIGGDLARRFAQKQRHPRASAPAPRGSGARLLAAQFLTPAAEMPAP